MNTTMIGKVWKFGDNIDTDQIVAATVMAQTGVPGEKELQLLKENAFAAIRKDFYKVVGQGDILVAGRNFGFGSHRESANTVLRLLGFQAIVAETFARIYFRNSIAIGFPAFEIPGITKLVEEGDTLEIDTKASRAVNTRTGEFCSFTPHCDMVNRILEVGSVFKLMHERIDSEKNLK